MSRKPHKRLPIGEAEVVAPLMDMISIKDGYRDIAEYLLSDVVVVHDLQAGLALWNRNGYHSTLVTPEGEVIDPDRHRHRRQRRVVGRRAFSRNAGAFAN